MQLSGEARQELARDRLENRQVILKDGDIIGVIVSYEEWKQLEWYLAHPRSGSQKGSGK